MAFIIINIVSLSLSLTQHIQTYILSPSLPSFNLPPSLLLNHTSFFFSYLGRRGRHRRSRRPRRGRSRRYRHSGPNGSCQRRTPSGRTLATDRPGKTGTNNIQFLMNFKDLKLTCDANLNFLTMGSLFLASAVTALARNAVSTPASSSSFPPQTPLLMDESNLSLRCFLSVSWTIWSIFSFCVRISANTCITSEAVFRRRSDTCFPGEQRVDGGVGGGGGADEEEVNPVIVVVVLAQN
jgi:hypothetical protein